MTLKEHIYQARQNKVAIGHFNISNLELLKGVFNAAQELSLPLVIGISEGERSFIGTKLARDLISSLKDQFDYPIFINADHTYSVEKIEAAAKTGYDSVVIDGAKLNYEQNVQLTRQAVEAAKAINPDILVEAELGYIGSSSKLLDEIPQGATQLEDSMPTPEQALDFVQQTNVDLVSPAVGNIHGMLKSSPNPSLNIQRIKDIASAINTPLVLHGGSGISDQDFTDAINVGISMIHISTELRRAYKDSLTQSLNDNPEEISPYKFLKPSVEAVQKVASNRLKLFNHLTD